MKVMDKTYTVELTDSEVKVLVDSLTEDCRRIGERITELKEVGTEDRQKDAQTIAALKAEYDPKKALRDALGGIVGTRFLGSDF